MACGPRANTSSASAAPTLAATKVADYCVCFVDRLRGKPGPAAKAIAKINGSDERFCQRAAKL